MNARRLLLWFFWAASLGFAYAGFENTMPPAELGAACFGALAGTAILASTAAMGPQRFRARWDWLPIYARRLPGAVLRETWDLLGPVLGRALLGRPPRGRFIALPFDAGGDDGRSASRRVAVIYGAAVTPNAIPVFVDRKSGLLVLHQLKHRIEPGAGDVSWPV
jgi:hypothetical protein